MYANQALQFSPTTRTLRSAVQAFERALQGGWWHEIQSRLTGRVRQLRALPGRVVEQHFAGAQAVPLEMIQGSEDRAEDFDADFHPLREESRDRWVSIFNAWTRGASLPPVELVEVGGVYYVRDGHHRISVARALGQDYVDALVIRARVQC